MNSTTEDKLCKICRNNEGKYVCPRCNVLYCSVNCYQNEIHAQCSEEFYKECVTNEMKSLGNPDAESQKKMMEMLQRLNESENVFESDSELDSDDDRDDDDDDDDDDLCSRLKDTDLNDADNVWNKLTNEEKQQFEQLLKSGDVAGILPEFEPWWNYKDDCKIIELNELSNFDKTHKHKCPDINSNIIPLSNLSKISPAPTVCYNLSNVLTAYAFLVRYYNNDHHEFRDEATVTLISISTNLSSNQNFTDFESAVKNVFFEITNSSWLNPSLSDTDILIRDVIKILQGPDVNNKTFYVKSALSDIHKLFSHAIKMYDDKRKTKDNNLGEFSKRFPDSGLSALPKLPKSKIKNCLKKIEYYLSWVVEFYVSPIL